METTDKVLEDSKKDSLMNELADNAKRELETKLGFRLSLVTIDPVEECFKLFHIPSTNVRQIEYSENIAAELYPEYDERIKAIQGEAD